MAASRTYAHLTDPGALLSTTHELADGSRVTLRLTRPSDAAGVRAFLESLSPEDRLARFRTSMPEVPEEVVLGLTFYDPRERRVVAATALVDGVDRLVGLADVTLAGTGLAQVGVVVDDHARGIGLGKLLAEAVASLALQRGAAHLKAEMIDGNRPMVAVLERLGPTVRRTEDGRSVAYTRLQPARASRAA